MTCACACTMASDASHSTSPSSSEAFPFEKSSRSYVWKYFRRDKCSAQCLLCNKAFVYNGGTTSNLIYHLERKHPSLRKPEAKQEGGQTHTTQQLSMRAFAQAQPRSNKPCSHNVQREITRILSRWPWLDMSQLPSSATQV